MNTGWLGSNNDSCRVCMCNEAEMRNIFSADNKDIIDRIQFCTGILLEQGNGLPSKMCKVCLNDLSVAYKFKTSCLWADNMFRNFENPIIKIEVPENDIDIGKTYNNISLKDEDCWDVSVDYKDTIANNELLGVLNEKSLDTLKTDVNRIPDNKLPIVRKKRGPYKKPKTKKNKKLKLKKCSKVKLEPFSCSTCKVKLDSKAQLMVHKKDHHGDTECWVCEVCGKVLTHRSSHASHVRSHAPPSYACAHCDYSTWYRHDLVKHLRIHDDIRLFQCEHCTASYRTSSNLLQHRRRKHDGAGRRRFPCTLCDKHFYDRTKLNRHLDSHNDIKRYKCEVCNSWFSRRCHWKKHLLRQHGVHTPPQRPGRRSVNFIAGHHLLNNTYANTLLTK